MNKIVGIVLVVSAIYLGLQMASNSELSDLTGNYDDEAFAKQVEGPGVVLVKFGANWCGPCRKMDQELDNLEGNIKVVKINVDRNRDLSQKFRVSGIPHTVLFKNGKPVGEKVGYRSATELSQWARQYGSGLPAVQNVSNKSNAPGNSNKSGKSSRSGKSSTSNGSDESNGSGFIEKNAVKTNPFAS